MFCFVLFCFERWVGRGGGKESSFEREDDKLNPAFPLDQTLPPAASQFSGRDGRAATVSSLGARPGPVSARPKLRRFRIRPECQRRGESPGPRTALRPRTPPPHPRSAPAFLLLSQRLSDAAGLAGPGAPSCEAPRGEPDHSRNC